MQQPTAWRWTYERYLHEEAVLARPPSQLYRLQKLVRRNRIVFLFGAAAVAALLLGTIISTLMFFKEREARTSEARLRKEAEVARKGVPCRAAGHTTPF